MRETILIIILTCIFFQMQAISSDTERVNSCLIELLTKDDTILAKIANEHQIAAQPTAIIFDYTAPPDSSQWIGLLDREFKMDFGVYYIGAIDAFLLIYHHALTVYKRIWPDAITPRLMERIIRIKEAEPTLVSENQLINIIKNLIVVNHKIGCSYQLNKSQFKTYKLKDMEVIEQVY